MKKGVLIAFAIFIVFTLSFTLFLYDEIFYEITGKQIFLDSNFEQEPGSFRPSNSNSISLSPGTDNCQIDTIYSSHTVARLGDTVSIYVEGKDGTNCDGANIEIKIKEKDYIFDDEVAVVSGNFSRNKATIDWVIEDKFSYLFDELFEGRRLEIYFETEELKSRLLFVFENPLLQPVNYQPIGYGCTNAFWIDRDCDGYAGTDAHSPRDEIPPFGTLDFVSSLGKDANDFDPAINTPASAASIYGGLDSAQEFKDWIQDLTCLDVDGNQISCYMHQLGNVYFISSTGNDNTGQVNNPSMPYRAVDSLRFILQPGDIVIVREGYNSVDMGPFPSQPTWPNYFKGLALQDIDGTPERPILVIAAPGERAWYNGYYNSMSWNANTHDLIVDGIEINGVNMFPEYKRSGLGIETNTRNIVLRNMEFTRHPAEIFGSVGVIIENLTLDSIVVHDAQGGQRQAEHGVYINNAPAGQYHKNIIVKDSLFYNRHRHGMQLRPGYLNLIVTRNIFHSNALRGIEIKGSIIDSVISDNLFFNNALMPFLINRESLHENSGPIDNVAFVHNTIWVGRYSNGMGDSCWMTLGAGCQTQSPNTDSGIGYLWDGAQITFTDMVASNNVIYLTGGSAFSMNWLPTFETAVIQKNFIYSTKTKPGNPSIDLAGMYSRCLTLPDDGTQDHTQSGDGWCAAPNNIMYHWSLNSFQNLGNRPFVNDNFLIPFSALANLFTDVNENYNYAPGSFNFNPVAPNPATDNSAPTYNTLRDIKGNLRDALPDAGAYEYLSGATPGPILVNINPQTANLNIPVTLNFNGFNFDSNSIIQECDASLNCDNGPSASGYVSNNLLEWQDYVPASVGIQRFRIRNLDNQVSSIRTINVLPPAPVAPSNLQSPGSTYSQVDLTWTEVSNDEDGFYVERSLSPTSGFIQIGINSANDNTFTDNTVNPSTLYYYRTRAYNSGGNSPYSNTLEVNVPIAPSCSSQSGNICSTNQFCPGTQLVHSGSGVCCNVACQEGNPNLVGHWKFDDTISPTDSALDSSGNNLVGNCASGACPNYAPAGGQINGAYEFDAINDEIVVPDNNLLDLTTQGSMMAWVRKESSKWHGIIAKGNIPNHAYEMEITPGDRFTCQVGGANFAISTTVLADNTYYHLACTWNSGTLRIYVNGVLEQTLTGVPNAPANNGNLHIGSWPPTSGPDWDWMDGGIDDVRVYNRDLNSQEIVSAMNSGGTQAFEFSISRNPISGTVQQGSSVSTTVTASHLSGTPSSVTFSASNLPAGVTSSFNPISCTPTIGSTCSSTLTLTASTLAGVTSNNQISILGTDGNIIRGTDYILTVTQLPPSTPTGLSVTTLSSSSLRIDWNDVAGETNYRLQRRVLSTGGFVDVPGAGSLPANVVTFTDTGLAASTSYEYQVQAYNAGGSSAFSSPVSGTTSPNTPGAPSISGITLATYSWISGSLVTINGQNFDNDAQVSVNGVQIDGSRLTRTSTSITFNRNAQEFNVGINVVVVTNPGSQLTVSGSFTLTSNPSISSIVPPIILNDVINVISINGNQFDPLAIVTAEGVNLNQFGLVTYVNPTLMTVILPSGYVGDFAFSVTSGDGLVSSTPFILRMNYPFFYVLSTSVSSATLNAGDTFNGFVKVETSPFVTHETVNFGVTAPSGMTVTLTENSCNFDLGIVPYPACDVDFSISTTGLSPGSYEIIFTSESLITSVNDEIPLTITISSPGSSTSGSSGGSSGGGGSGGPRPRAPTVVYQCDDDIDNDGDGFTDFTEDMGCSTLNDNSELDPSEIVEPTKNWQEEEAQNIGGQAKDIEIRVVYLLVTSILIIAISIVSLMIIRSIRKKSSY